MFCIMHNLTNAQVRIFSLANLNIGHYVKLTCFEGKLGGVESTFTFKWNKFKKLYLKKVYIRNQPNFSWRKAKSTQ